MSEPKNIHRDAAFVAELTRTMSFHDACSKVWRRTQHYADQNHDVHLEWIDEVHTAVADKWHAVAVSGAVVCKYVHNTDSSVTAEQVRLGSQSYYCIYWSTGLNHVQLEEPGSEFTWKTGNVPGCLILRVNREELRRNTVPDKEMPRQVTVTSISEAVSMTVCSHWIGYGDVQYIAILELDGVKFTAFHGVCFKMELFDVKSCNGVIPYCVVDTRYGRYRITTSRGTFADRLDWTWLTFLEKELQEMGCQQVFINGVLT